MKRIVFILIFLFFVGYNLFAQILEPVKWTFESRQNGSEATLIFKAAIEQGWHLYDTELPEGGPIKTSIHYADSTLFDFDGALLKDPQPTVYMDKTFNLKLGYFTKQAVLTQKIKLKRAEKVDIKGTVEFMSCNDETCTPPSEAEFTFNLKDGSSQSTINTAPIIPSNNPDQDQQSHGLGWFLFFSFLAGLAAILTPCVFPMIPMTVSFFMNSGESKLKARINAIFYGISIILIYTVIGTLMAVIFGPGIANWLSTHWLPNLVFFAVFMLFAFSFFGMFEIVLPSWMVNKSDQQVDKGGLMGSFFMALTLVLVSFSCTGPIVGAILVQSAGGAVLKPIVGMFGFSMAFALPFTLFALFPGWLNNLPKSGGWLNSVKVVLGFLELALGLKFLSIADQTYHWGILDREVYLALWIVIFLLLGFYLLGKLKFSHDSEVKTITVPRLMLAIITFSFVVYLIPGMFGAPLKALSGYMPPQTTLDFDLHQIIRDEIKLAAPVNSTSALTGSTEETCDKPKFAEFLHLPHGLQGYFDYEQGMACARKLNKPVFIDFTGHGCVNCREMEANVWSDPRVLERLMKHFVIIALYVDDKSTLPESEWVTSTYDGKVKKTLGKKYADFQISRYKVNAQPYYVLLDGKEQLLVQPKAYDLDADHFVDFLDAGIAEFNRRK
ncbi:MAG TPA: disulfide bond formation protein DsbD [Prolixibacteraceae bacterium]|jgi:thiol:disulfide interchange protein DsbD|nr:disulfide bond formation protein DsbD [Prolixibacteraceae bacterium]